jgi:hypothetical protein
VLHTNDFASEQISVGLPNLAAFFNRHHLARKHHCDRFVRESKECFETVRQGICVETGAISTASPARQSGGLRIDPSQFQKSSPTAGFYNSAVGLQSPILTGYRTKSLKVSGGCLKYSRFRETAAGD